MRLFSSFLLLILLFPLFSSAQNSVTIDRYYKDASAKTILSSDEQQIKANNFLSISVDMTKLKKDLVKAKHRSIESFASDVFIKIPDPKGESTMFRVLANTTMHPDYQEKYPGIRTYDVISMDNPSIQGKIDFTQKGFHAMIFDPSKGTYFIDPLYAKNSELHMVYFKKDFISDKEMQCEFVGNPKYKDLPVNGTDKSFGNCELKTYRLAVSATGEYTVYHGGDVADAAAAQVTTMNRVNGVYERDMAVTMEIIANNDDIIYTDALTDPFSNGNPSLMINQNQTNTNLIIGSSNYDIGHVFGTNSGGLAGLGVVCSSSSKARGVTGSSNPINDPFDIDYVAHEMGHQFGCNHTFNNSCGGNRNNSTAMEPGSGSTIMAYAGICSPNVQNNSDDHFHGISVEEMGDYIDGNGGNCPVITPLVNSAPEINSTTGDVFIPANTPFALTADVTDIDGDSLLYCWDQMDNEISTQAPVSTSTSGPNFRSISPHYSPTRYFPNLSDLANGVSPTWEVLASVSRTFSFRLIVRDNAAGGGCNDHADLTVNTVATAGPFIVTYPNATGITWSGFSTQTVTWNVTNTDLSPINCQFVDIFLSIDGGETYPTQLANDVANDGSHSITVPNTPSNDCRIMVMAQNGSFFDISNNDFEITEVTFDYTLNTTEANQAICQPDTVVYTIEVGSIGGYNDEVTLSLEDLPAGAIGEFDVTTVTPPATVYLTISGSQNLSSDNYSLLVNGLSTTGSKLLSLQYQVFDEQLDPVVLISPVDAATGVQLAANLSWENDGFGVNYTVEVATDNAFMNIVQSISNLTATSVQLNALESNTSYYWRVKGSNNCADGDFSSTFSFTTVGCNEVFSSDVPKVISATSTPTITSTLDVTSSGQVLGISVVNLTGQHTWINDLSVSLTSPQGTTISLFSGICDNEDDFDVNFDDFASSASLPCPPTDGGTYQPAQPLSTFIGEVAQGTWTLTISDSFNQDGGSLDSWGLNLCIGNCINAEAPVLYTNNEVYCFGEPITIVVESGNLNDASDWFWYEGDCDGMEIGTGSNITVYPEVNTTYYAKGGGFCGGPCTAIDIDLLPIPESSTEEIYICQGESYTFPDGTTSFSNTVHTSVVTASNGCDSSIVTDLNVINLNSTVIQNNGVLSSNQSSSSSTYQWVDCNNNLEPIPGETGQSFTPTQNGSYAVILTSTGVIPCQETSNCIEVIGVGINEQDLGAFSVFPNPSSGSFTLQLNDISTYSKVEVIDYRGRVVYQLEIENEKEIKIDLENESDGIYILKLLGEKNVKIEKLIKQ